MEDQNPFPQTLLARLRMSGSPGPAVAPPMAGMGPVASMSPAGGQAGGGEAETWAHSMGRNPLMMAGLGMLGASIGNMSGAPKRSWLDAGVQGAMGAAQSHDLNKQNQHQRNLLQFQKEAMEWVRAGRKGPPPALRMDVDAPDARGPFRRAMGY